MSRSSRAHPSAARRQRLPRYPFPDQVNPEIDNLVREYHEWIDTDYAFHSDAARAMHKAHRLTDIAARAFPCLSLAELRPVARFTATGAMMDDYLDRCSHDEMMAIRDRISALLAGVEEDEPTDFGVLRQFFLLRQDALACAMPSRLYDRFVEAVDRMIVGYGDEKQYVAADTPPPLAVYLVLREHTSGGLPYARYLCMQKDFRTLPDQVLHHAHILRMHSLMAWLIGMHNDLVSLPKELARKGDVINIVRVLQQEHDLTIEAAAEAALELHDTYLADFITLAGNLPDFGPWQSLVEEYVHHAGIMVQGVYAWHTNDRTRYQPGGYVEPEFHSQEFSWTT